MPQETTFNVKPVYQSHRYISSDVDLNIYDTNNNFLENTLGEQLTPQEEQRQRQRTARRCQRLAQERHDDACYAAAEVNPYKWMP